MGLKIGGEVEKVNGKELTYAEFVEKYLDRNHPVILTGLTDDWRACKDWVSGDGKPNLRFISDQFGCSRVQVADCATREFTDQKRLEMSVSEFIQLWISSSSSDNGGADGKPLLYLKDWHFVKEYPDYAAYSTPVFFLDDWLNLYLDKHHMHVDPESYQERNEVNCSDYRFVYTGAKGTWTPLHADVFRSYSWSANVCGRKQWYFLSPSQHHLVFDRYMKSSVYNIFEDVCKSKYPKFEEAVWLECTQERDEIIFVPSGWYHQVHNLEDTISINHNWFNGYNISWVWDLLLREYHEAAGYIEDLKECNEFEELCQRNLAANAGMDFRDFFIFLIRFALANFVMLYQITSSKGFINLNSSEASQFFLFNLKNIKCITLKMISEPGWQNCSTAATDLAETFEEQSFMDFCDSLGRTYSMMYNLSGIDFSQIRTLFDHEQTSGLYPYGSHICNPDDLITFLDHAFRLVGSES
ncbi:2-oxoglutarate and iron-dependent oxygenase JMJD4-like [Salvia splendens]|uniref:2-oxoglutarate and iron-dependent oxygenase JMJD4-like n=1 Tax=Salvia splendens TaxID=180675 RepID=UPI001C26D858|nr:2-oxoglutarate and iron-dependent oxygenase JMJD4-like [Salvia splendens]